MAIQVSARTAVLTQDDFRAQAPSGAVLTAQMVTTLDGEGRLTLQHGTQAMTLTTGDLATLLELVRTVHDRHELYQADVPTDRFTGNG